MLPLAAQVLAPAPLPEIPVDPNLIASQVVPLIGAAIAGLEQNVAQLQREVGELAERLDFAERMLADRRQPQLRAGEPSGHHG